MRWNSGRPQAQKRVGELMREGLQKDADVESRLPVYTGKLGESSR